MAKYSKNFIDKVSMFLIANINYINYLLWIIVMAVLLVLTLSINFNKLNKYLFSVEGLPIMLIGVICLVLIIITGLIWVPLHSQIIEEQNKKIEDISLKKKIFLITTYIIGAIVFIEKALCLFGLINFNQCILIERIVLSPVIEILVLIVYLCIKNFAFMIIILVLANIVKKTKLIVSIGIIVMMFAVLMRYKLNLLFSFNDIEKNYR